MPVIRYFPVFPENPTNPARTNILTGDVHINLRRWRQLPLHTRKYVLAHEQGHAKYHTLNELTADRYALEQLALTAPYSFLSSIPCNLTSQTLSLPVLFTQGSSQ